MKNLTAIGVVSITMSAAFAPGCDVHDNTINIPNATINATANADLNNVTPDETVPVAVTVQNVFLVDPAATPPIEHTEDAGHLQIYLDDVSTPPILVTAQVTFNITIPADTKAGGHKIICRVHKHDGTPTSTMVEISITVKVTVSGTDAGTVFVTVDSSTVVTVDSSTTDPGTVDAASPSGN